MAQPTPSFPFDDPDADLIIQSSDGVNFRVYKVILAKASSIFKDMLTVPLPPTNTGDDFLDGLPVVRLAEDGLTLKRLLLLVYPIGEKPPFTTFEEMVLLMTAGVKYDMIVVVNFMTHVLLVEAQWDPFRVLVTAWRCGWKDIGRTAARLWLRIPMSNWRPPYPPELQTISAEVFCQFLDYRHRCEEKVTELLRDLRWLDKDKAGLLDWEADPTCIFCPGGVMKGVDAEGADAEGADADYDIAEWFSYYLERVTPVLKQTPWGPAASDYSIVLPVSPAASCKYCTDKTAAVAQILAQHVEQAVNQIKLDM